MPATVHPITEHDAARVDAFLREHLNPRVDWEASMQVPWTVDAPNGGFMLLDDDTVVGAHLAFYSERTIAGRREKFCNLAAWCVLPEHRFQGMRLLKALLGPGRLPLHRPVAERQRGPAQPAHGLPGARHPHRARAQPAVAEPAGPLPHQRGPGGHRAHAHRPRPRALPRPPRHERGPSRGADPRRGVVLRRLPQGPAQEPPAVREHPVREPPGRVPAARAAVRPPSPAAPRRARRR